MNVSTCTPRKRRPRRDRNADEPRPPHQGPPMEGRLEGAGEAWVIRGGGRGDEKERGKGRGDCKSGKVDWPKKQEGRGSSNLLLRARVECCANSPA
eukprot:774560-Pyramimonas_sp.AAC.1